MTYFSSTTGTGLAQAPPPMPPQAATNGMAGLLGMLPPQAATNGMGQDMVPLSVPTGDPEGGAPQQLSPLLPGGTRSFRDGIFGRREPDPFGESLRPWRDGVFGPGLPGGLGQNGGGIAPGVSTQNGEVVVDLGSPEVISDIKRALNLMVPSYRVTQGPTWDDATRAAYVTWAEEATPGYEDKAPLYLLSNGLTYPSALGLTILMMDTLQEWRAIEGPERGEARWLDMYESLARFQQAYEASGRKGHAVLPTAAAEQNGGESMIGPLRASTVTYIGIGAVAIGLGYLLLR